MVAVTAVQIDGVLHEFSSIPGVREDVTDIILNIKEIALSMQGEGPKRMVVRKQGPGMVTAGDIQTVGDIEVLNPDLVLCTLDEGAEIRMEFTVNTGKGYVPAERNRPEDAPIGLIPVDSLYSPVRQVSYKVENARVGQELDYDKLSLTVETLRKRYEFLKKVGSLPNALKNIISAGHMLLQICMTGQVIYHEREKSLAGL